MQKQKIIIILGPTASGKTGLSIKLAKKIGGEVISADSRQVYRELNIGTEKVTKNEMGSVPHYCIDIASPKRTFTVAQWCKHAEKAIKKIVRNGNIPIIAGGTAFYIDSLVYGTDFPSVKPNTKLRKQLEKKSAEELFEILKKLDYERAKTVEQKNPRRLMRSIEIATELGKVPKLLKQTAKYDVVWIGINPGLDTLMKKIINRLDDTFERGLIKEVKKVRNEIGLSWKRINELGLEYRTVGEYLRKEITKEEMREKIIRELRKYAKRQMTWMKRNKKIKWYKNGDEALNDFKL